MRHSITETERILSLDMLRSFAALGLLLIYFLSLGAVSATIYNPTVSFAMPSDIWVWAAVELMAEGVMRALLSILFGAGVLLFLGHGVVGGKPYFKRAFWLLVFGLLNGYLLMWPR